MCRSILGYPSFWRILWPCTLTDKSLFRTTFFRATFVEHQLIYQRTELRWFQDALKKSLMVLDPFRFNVLLVMGQAIDCFIYVHLKLLLFGKNFSHSKFLMKLCSDFANLFWNQFFFRLGCHSFRMNMHWRSSFMRNLSK